MRLRLLLGGVKSALPFVRSSYHGTGGTADARYCYSVWLRHLSLIHAAGLDAAPESVAEFGPGDSVGIGVAALLSGARRYAALDVVDHVSRAENLRIFDELVPLFRARADLPAGDGLAGVHPRLASYAFPSAALPDDRLDAALDPARLAAIRGALGASTASADAAVRYICPWHDQSALPAGSVDLVLSQVALQEMDDGDGDDSLGAAFRASAAWLRPGGIASHQIDFRTPGGPRWNEHWTYPELAWRIARGRRQRFENRAPLSRYLELCRAHGFRVVHVLPTTDRAGSVARSELAPRWRALNDEDLTTTGAYILAVKS